MSAAEQLECVVISVLVASCILSRVAAAETYKIAVIMDAFRSALEADQRSFEKVP